MRRFFPYAFCLLAILLQVAPAAAAGAEDDSPETIELTLSPAAEPTEALRYRLLPPVLDQRPGNAALFYNRIGLVPDPEGWEEAEEKIADWLDVPLAELPLEEVEDILQTQRDTFEYLHLATLRTDCDWQLPLGETDPISLLLPEVQKARSFARLIALKARLQIAQGKFDDAIRTLQQGHALGRHIGTGRTLVSGLVGIAICGVMAKQVEELIQQPGAPNLYWALAALPDPLVDIRPAVEMETNLMMLMFPQLEEVEKMPRSVEHWRVFLDELIAHLTEWSGERVPAWQGRMLATGMAIRGYPMARRYLIETGRSAEEVEAMPVAQVVTIYSLLIYREARDRTFKWFHAPYWQAREGLLAADERMRNEVRQKEVVPIASMLLPAVGSVRFSVARGDRTVAVLRVIEALRTYAAAHDGKLPEELSDIQTVPVPIDPIHGKPFSYSLEGDTAVLESPAPPGRRQRDHGLRYVIRLRK